MTAFTPGTGGSIPSDATTLEKAIIWIFEEARRLQPVAEYQVIAGSPPSPICQGSVSRILYHGTRFTGLAFVPIEPNYLSLTGKHWTKVITGQWIDANSPDASTETFLPGTGGSIPSSVDTIQKALIWAAQAYELVNYGSSLVEIPYDPNTGAGGEPIPMALSKVVDTLDHGPLNMCRISVPVNRDWANQSAKIYTQALVQSSVALGTSVTTN